MQKTLGVCVIGCGGISSVHLPAIAKMKDAKLCVVCDEKQERAQKAAQTYGALATTDWKQAIDTDGIDIVHVLTPHYLHAPMTRYALSKGKWVVCEKPVASEVEDAKEIASIAGGRVGVVFQNRYNTSASRTKEIVESGALGKLLTLRASVCWHREAPYYLESGWRGVWKTEGGGVLINQAIHTLDLLLWFAGSPSRIKGSITTDLLQGIIEVEDHAHLTIAFASGINGILHATTDYGIDAPVEIELVLEGGTLRLSGDSLLQTKDGVTSQLTLPPEATQDGKAYWGSSHEIYLNEFYACVRENRPVPIGAQEGLTALSVLKAAYQSSSNGGWVTL